MEDRGRNRKIDASTRLAETVAWKGEERMGKEKIEPEQPETRFCLWCLVKPALPRIAYCSEECDKLAYQNTFGLKDNGLDPKGS